MPRGWIKLHRKILDWPLYRDGDTLRLFLHLLLVAESEPRVFKGIQLKPGQVATTYQELADQLGMTYKQVRGRLGALKRADCTADFRTGNFLVISILSWGEYQAKGQTFGQTKGRPLGNPYILNKEIKNKEAAAPQFSPDGERKETEGMEVDEYGYRWE